MRPFSNRFFQLLNIHPGEWIMVKQLFLLQFFQGAGIALFFTSALSQFLKRFPISELAYVFIISAFLLWITGYICNRLEHRLSVHRLSIVLTLIIAASMLFFWLGPFVFTQDWFYYLMLAWFNALYLINNLEFWGLAAQLYDVRQSKRLFGVISSGDIPAKFLGYTFALLLVPYVGAQNLLLAGFAGVMLSLLFITKVFRSITFTGVKKQTHKIKQEHTVGIAALWRNFSSNRLILSTAVLSMIAFTGFVLVEYAFYAEIKESKSYKTDEAFATFTALFMGCARLFAWILKLTLTSRLAAGIGNRNSLLITPIALLLFNIAVLFINRENPDSNLILYVFGSAAILVDALRASINSPVLLTILQPLSTPERLRAHNIVKGVMDPFAYLGVGILLLFLYGRNLYQLVILSWILIAVSIVWSVVVFVVQKQYIKTLISAISSRYFQKDEINVADKATLEKITAKIQDGTELEVLYLLKLLEENKLEIQPHIIEKALQHPSTAVCMTTLDLIAKLKITGVAPAVTLLSNTASSAVIRAKAIAVLSALSYDHAALLSFLSSDDELLQQAAMESIFKFATKAEERIPAFVLLDEWTQSPKKHQRITAARLISKVNEQFPERLSSLLMNDPDKDVQHAAISAVGETGNPVLLRQLPVLFPAHTKQVMDALFAAGEKSIPYIQTMLQQKKITAKQESDLILLCGRIGGPKAEQLLFQLLQNAAAQVSVIIKALNRMNYSVDETSRSTVDKLTNDQLLRSVELLFMLNRLHSSENANKIILNSLHLELMEARETILNLFSFYTEKEQVDKIKKALLLNQKETAANALELIEVTIRKDFAFTFNTVFEDADISFRCSMLKKVIHPSLYENLEQVVTRILKKQEDDFNHWTKACSLHSIKLHSLHIKDSVFHQYLQSPNRLLQETAVFAAS